MNRNSFTTVPDDVREIRHFHLFCGLGGGAKGFNKAQPRVGKMVGKFRCIGGIDINAPAIRDFERMTGTRGTVLDMFDRSQYTDFHGMEPPSGWREAGPEDIRVAAGGEYPHIVFLSAPCKGFSGLLSENKSRTDKYQALNRLTVRGVWLMLEAFADNLPELIIFENVPRIANRGRHLLDQIGSLLAQYGYAVAETTHDCGEIGGLAQSRKRFLLVARHIEKVPPFLYEPDKKRLQSVGTVLDRMPLPGEISGGPMHRVPQLQWKTWVRLAFVEAGSDWRSLNKLEVSDGVLRDYLIVPEYRPGYLGVNRWDKETGTVAGRSTPSNGAFSIADPRPPIGALEYSQYGVMRMQDTSGAVINVKSPGQGTFSVADPRPSLNKNAHHNLYRIISWSESSKTIASGSHVAWGALSVGDPRTGMERSKGDNYLTAGHYGIVKWGEPCGAVSASACHDNGRWSVADHRMPEANDKLVCVIRALDGTWHRPFTTLELAALQSLVDPEEYLELDGLSDSDWRERIGNAVPPNAAEEIAKVMGTTLLLAWSGETFLLSSAPIWVRPVAVALAVAHKGDDWCGFVPVNDKD